MLKKPVAAAILAALSIGVVANVYADTTPTANPSTSTAVNIAAAPQDTTQQSTSTDQSTSGTQDQKAKRLDTVVVSGSLINNAQIQTATPTYTITAADIQARGFNSVTDVLQSSVFATGSVQGPQESGGFTQGAQTISLYGLNPEYTLTLIDGKPITQFGQLYNGQSNFTNISNIPISMVDHIDIIPGGGSSIYGSQAIAGVVNIVTKQHMDGVEVLVRAGGYDGGGGASQRIAISFGHDYGKLNVLGSFEFDNQSPMWAYQRDFTATTPHDEPVATIPDYGNINEYTGAIQGYISPPNGCGPMSGLFNGTTNETTSSVAGRYGTYCGSQHVLGYTTMLNQSRSYDGMLKLRYDLNDHVRLYSDVLMDVQTQKFTPGSDFIWWGPIDQNNYPSGLIEDAKTGDILDPERIFAPEEVGNNYYNELTRQFDLMYQADVGANGTFGDSNWNWDAYFLRSGDRTSVSAPERLASAVDGYFNSILGPSLGMDPNTGLNMYNPNYAKFFTPLTPAQIASFTVPVEENSNTWVNNARATISNDSLFHLPGGDAGFAALIEGGSEAWYEPANPLVEAGDIWGQTATSGGGTRNHAATAFQLNLPVFKPLTFDISGRYDRYSLPQGGETNGKFTFKAGVEYRPFDTLLLRGNYATSFLAPDMSALYLGPSGNYQSVTDYYLCQVQNGGKNCASDFSEEVEGTLYSNKDLKPTTAKSWTGGFVWAPLNNMSFSVDYLHIAITNEIAPQPADLLMRQDSQCLLGQLPANSQICQTVVGPNGNDGQVQRNAVTGQVSTISQYYINISNEVTDSITSELKYQFSPTPVGTFGLQFDYNDMLKHSYQIYPGSLPINQLTNPLYSSEFKSIVSGALNWSLHDKYASTLYWHRYGSSPNYTGMVDGPNFPGAGSVAPWITFNYSFTYTPIPGLDLSLLVNNLTNKMPPRDPSYTAFPFFNTENYNVYGREIMGQIDYRFGGSK
ncbi:TonB-dependent receptor [Dyella dinghuensis]|uniref:TonB-dependent receptor n=1 Tax=Dyella dinghuensis TaxID=1920169 RepID=A0A3S0REA9_9GAMM|nr:TonB-dependent receptor [Dyella dinghuensis]RUL64121.1 TonB-dependent receptor [Dyella dinghuensis]